MKLLIAGGTGFIGRHLINHLKNKHQITVLTRDTKKSMQVLPKIAAITWADKTLQETLASMDVVINLVGENIGDRRWSKSIKSKILKSRTETTSQLCLYINQIPSEKRPRLFNTSAIGVYGLQPDITSQNQTVYDEQSIPPSPPTDFLSEVGTAWETPLKQYDEIDGVTLRLSVVLHPSGGMLKKIRLPYQLGLAGRIGTGCQPFSWIALHDLISIVSYLLEHPELTGVFNLVAPEVVTQKQFARLFSRYLNRPCFIPTPAFLVKLLFGQMGNELLLQGQNVKSERLKNFPFKYKTLDHSLFSNS